MFCVEQAVIARFNNYLSILENKDFPKVEINFYINGVDCLNRKLLNQSDDIFFSSLFLQFNKLVEATLQIKIDNHNQEIRL